MATTTKAKFDIKTTATRPLYAGVGVTDLVVEYLRGVQDDVTTRVVDVQKSVRDIDLEPKALRDQAVTVVNARVDALSKDAQARRKAIEARVAELQTEARAIATGTFTELVARGEKLVSRIRNQQATKQTVSSAKTTSAKAKTTKTQATKATKKTASTAKRTAAKKSSTPKSSAKATGTAAKKTVSSAAKATSDAASKVGN